MINKNQSSQICDNNKMNKQTKILNYNLIKIIKLITFLFIFIYFKSIRNIF
jgi:hypothetical protein